MIYSDFVFLLQVFEEATIRNCMVESAWNLQSLALWLLDHPEDMRFGFANRRTNTGNLYVRIRLRLISTLSGDTDRNVELGFEFATRTPSATDELPMLLGRDSDLFSDLACLHSDHALDQLDNLVDNLEAALDCDLVGARFLARKVNQPGLCLPVRWPSSLYNDIP